METGVPSSFIPPDTVEPVARHRSGRGSLTDFFGLITVVLFVTSIALAVGVFLYNQFLETSKKSKIEQLTRARAAFDPGLIADLTRLDDRMNVAQKLLTNHFAPSIFFNMLELTTLQTVSFKTLAFDVVNEKEITIKMDGVAESVNSVALQADIFSNNGIITSPIFSNINRGDDGVRFNLTALVNPSAVRYSVFFATPTDAGAGGAQQQSREQAPQQPQQQQQQQQQQGAQQPRSGTQQPQQQQGAQQPSQFPTAGDREPATGDEFLE